MGEENPENISHERSDNEPVIISRFSDLILVAEVDEAHDEPIEFRCDSSRLKEASAYFCKLLEANRFQEGAAVAEQHAALRTKYSNVTDAKVDELPRVKITYIGQVSVPKSIKPLMTDFFRILHGNDIRTAARNPPSSHIANLAIVADLFDAVTAVSHWSRSKKSILPRIVASQLKYDEEIYRQRLLTSQIFRHDARHVAYSHYLILNGSCMWRNGATPPNPGLWWELPRGLEEELQFRRICILQTIFSMQHYLLLLYTSKDRQCKLGYDTSPQCDSFQLGEFIKFSTRLGTLDFQSHLLAYIANNSMYAGDIIALIKSLRACPSYQVDPNHSHCGPKKLLTAGLDIIQDKLGESSVGVCLQCSQNTRDTNHIWHNSKRPLYFNSLAGDRLVHKAPGACDRWSSHGLAQELFTAEEVNWSDLLNFR